MSASDLQEEMTHLLQPQVIKMIQGKASQRVQKLHVDAHATLEFLCALQVPWQLD